MRGAPPDPGDIAPLPEAGSREQALLLGLKPDSRVAIEGKFYDYDPSELSPKQRLRYEELVRSGKVVIHPPVVTIAGPQVKMETVLSFGNLWDRPAASKHEVPDDWVRIRGRSAKVPIDAGGIKSVTVDDGLVSAIELSTGESVQRTASPELYAYVQPLLYPLLGFFLPLGAIRAITWIGVGFFEPKAPAA